MVNSEELTGTTEYLTQQVRRRINRCPCNWGQLCYKISFTAPLLALLTTGYYH